MKRLLILSASAGAGHNRAAEALDAACAEFHPGVKSQWADSLKYTPRLFRKFYEQSYLWMASKSPMIWGMLYKLTGKKTHPRADKLVRTYDRVSYTRLMKFIDKVAPDAVIATHFLPPNVIHAHRGRHLPVYTVVTDYDVHPMWYNPGVAGYFVPTEETKVQLARLGCPEDRIRVTGIPIHPIFSRTRETACRALKLPENRPVVLFMSGGFGMGDMETAVNRLLRLADRCQLVVVCGKNESLRKRISRISGIQVHGFVKNVQDFMQESDLVITKAGGLTVSECLAKGAPMVIYSPIPGQEERNCDYLLERGAAVKAKGLDVLDFKVAELLEAPDKLATMKRSARAAARPHAAREILGHVLG